MDVPEQSKVPDVSVGGVPHAADPEGDEGSGHWRREGGAWLVQQLNVDILDDTGQEAVDEAPHSPGVLTLDVVMLDVHQNHLWGNVKLLKCWIHATDVVILNLIIFSEQVVVIDMLQLRVDMSVRVGKALMSEIIPGVLYHSHQLS